MKILTDLHCHTIASNHAYSTVKEIMDEAAKKGLEAVAITDHGPEQVDSPHLAHFGNLRAIPDYVSGVRLLRGCEANILDGTGRIDIPEVYLKRLDFVVAGIHSIFYYKPSGGDHTSTYLGVLNNPYVDMISHSGFPYYAYDIDVIVKKAKELGKLIEFNNASYEVRPDNIERCAEIAKACKKYGTGVAVNSDSHFCTTIGDVSKAMALLKSVDFPEELIMNRDLKTLKEFLAPRKKI